MWWDNIKINPDIQHIGTLDLDTIEKLVILAAKDNSDQGRYLAMQAGGLYADHVLLHYMQHIPGTNLTSKLRQIISMPDVTCMAYTLKDAYDIFTNSPVLPSEPSILYPWQTLGFIAGVTGLDQYHNDFEMLRYNVEQIVHPGDMMMTDYTIGIMHEIHKNK